MWFRLQQQQQLHRHWKSLLRQSQSRSQSRSRRTMPMKMKMKIASPLPMPLSLPLPSPFSLLPIRDKKQNYCFIPFRCFATSKNASAGDEDEDENGNSDDDYSYSHLLTRATARQLKGDVTEAINLTNQALEIIQSQSHLHRTADDSLQLEIETADALVFLGKLHGLKSTDSSLGSANAVKAVTALEEARSRYQQALQTQTPEQQQEQELQVQQTSWHETKRKELVGLSHLASAKARLCLQRQEFKGHSQPETTPSRYRSSSSTSSSNSGSNTDTDTDSAKIEIEIIHDHFREALEGFSEGFSSSATTITTTTNHKHKHKHNDHTPRLGWKDGMTNHVAHEWSDFCASQGDFKTAREILIHAQQELSQVFGETDPRVLQLNGRLAELLLLRKQQQQQSHVKSYASTVIDDDIPSAGLDLEPSLSPPPPTTTISISPPIATATAEEDAMALLEMTLDKLPPNSPEARRIFMQLEDLKDKDSQQRQRETNESESEP